jgi:hypothetical protein
MTIADYFHAPISCTVTEASREPSRRSRQERLFLIAATIAVAMIALGVNLKIGRQFESLGVFGQYDVLFHSDPVLDMEALESWGFDSVGRRRFHAFAHPNHLLYLHPLIQAGTEILTWGNGNTPEGENVRRALIVLVGPAASAIKAICLLWVFVGLGLSLVQALPLTLLGCVSFSQIIFGSMPETFPVSGMLLAAASLLAVRSCHRGSRRWQWILGVVLIAGVTITNAIAVALLFAGMRRFAGKKFLVVMLDTMAVIGIGILLTFSISAGFGSIAPAAEIEDDAERFIAKWSVDEPFYVRAAGFPTALVNTVVAPRPTRVENPKARRDRSKYHFRFSLADSPSVFSVGRIIDGSLLLLFSVGMIGCWRGSAATRYLGIGSAAIVGFNWILHTFWGVEYFLYTQHWHVSFLIPLAGLYSFSPTARRYATPLILTAVAIAISRNRTAMDAIWSGLER